MRIYWSLAYLQYLPLTAPGRKKCLPMISYMSQIIKQYNCEQAMNLFRAKHELEVVNAWDAHRHSRMIVS